MPAAEVLRAPTRVAAASPVALAGVEASVWPELQLPAVVIRGGLVEREEKPPRPGNDSGVRGVRAVARYPCVPAHVRVVDVKEAVGPVPRVEGETEQQVARLERVKSEISIAC